ncbi:MAG: AraC family transcriptional regulator [Tissierellales bacterium]|nr:AraC family transcriptional regulator [Bacteroidales bacterium]MBN2826501.1 AraC family transcriptional regulator [Tissierellales bacterium]
MEEFKSAALLFSVFAPFSWLAAMLLSGMYKTAAKRHLLFLLLFAGFTYILTYAKFEGHLVFYTELFTLQAFIVPMLFPLFYLYFKTITSEKMCYNWKYYIHFLMPFLLSIAYFTVSKIWMNQEEEMLFMQSILHSEPESGTKFVFGFYLYSFGRLYYLVSSLFYLILISRCYRRYKALIINIFPSDQTKELNWIKGVGLLLIGVALFNSVIHYLRNNELASQDMLIAISYITFGTFFWTVGLFGYRQPDIYNSAEIIKTERFDNNVRIDKSAIEAYLNTSKAYLNPEMNIYHLCTAFKTNRTYLSSEINNQFQLNFRSLINSYRIVEAKSLILESKKNHHAISFEQIAIDSGFNSYSSFLRVFKTVEGISPSEYYKKT